MKISEDFWELMYENSRTALSYKFLKKLLPN